MSGIIFPECKSCNKHFVGTSTVLCGACSEKEISSLKEKVKELEKNLQTQCGYTLSEAEKVKQLEARIAILRAGLEKIMHNNHFSICHATEYCFCHTKIAEQALFSSPSEFTDLEATVETYSREWDASRKQASLLAEKVEQKDVKIRELETELMHKGRSYPVIKFSEILSLQAQIAVLRAGLEDIGKILDKGGWSRVAEMIVAQALSSDGSEFLEAVRDVTEAVEELLEPMPHLLHGVIGENTHADISERIENAEKSLSRLRGLV